ncbi:MAG: hypothetical protein E7013_03455 [Alphaproteobacteria bacterium]|nr:hypothetical protein [Alphaproteobacteria bacterium]
MKKLMILALICASISTGALAQQKTKKIPFLPYAGMPVQTQTTSATTATTATAKSSERSYVTIYFNKGSSGIRKDQQEKIVRLGKRLSRSRNRFYSIVSFTAPNIDDALAKERASTVAQALADFNAGEAVFHIEHRPSPVKNPNRVEVYLNTSQVGLGNASSNFGNSY